MAKRGTSKRFSVDHEEHIAQLFRGRRSASSGGADNDSGDVRSIEHLIECKTTGSPDKPSRLPTFVHQLEKIADEAWSEGRTPILALRYFNPDSNLSDRDGWIDLLVTRAGDVI